MPVWFVYNLILTCSDIMHVQAGNHNPMKNWVGQSFSSQAPNVPPLTAKPMAWWATPGCHLIKELIGSEVVLDWREFSCILSDFEGLSIKEYMCDWRWHLVVRETIHIHNILYWPNLISNTHEMWGYMRSVLIDYPVNYQWTCKQTNAYNMLVNRNEAAGNRLTEKQLFTSLTSFNIITLLHGLPLVLVWLWWSCHLAAESSSLSFPSGFALGTAHHMKLL